MEGDAKAALRVRFENATGARANRLAEELDSRVRQLTAGEVSTRRVREHEDTQDLGAVLEFLIDVTGTRFAVEIAKGLRDFIAKSGSRVVIETPSGKVVMTGDAASNIDVAALAAALQDPGAWAEQSAE